MPRFKLILEYDGAPFVGWQRQNNGFSVQEALEGAIFAMTGERATAHGAGRTDAGVHALGRSRMSTSSATGSLFGSPRGSTRILFLTPWRSSAPSAWLKTSTPGIAPAPAIISTEFVNRRAPLTLEKGRAWRLKPRLDAEAMREAARALVGRHDFSTFRDAQCQAASPIRTLDRLDVKRDGDEVLFETSALSFLHRQVRSMVGSLVDVGSGRWSASDLEAALKAADRSRCGQVAPASGLYLARVDY